MYLRVHALPKQGVQFLHRRGIIHRDLKSLNVLLNYDERTGDRTAKISDFGLAKVNSAITTATGCGLGVHSKVRLLSVGQFTGQSSCSAFSKARSISHLCAAVVSVAGRVVYSRGLACWHAGLTFGTSVNPRPVPCVGLAPSMWACRYGAVGMVMSVWWCLRVVCRRSVDILFGAASFSVRSTTQEIQIVVRNRHVAAGVVEQMPRSENLCNAARALQTT